MNLRHMEVFRAVMLAGTVRGAAQLLHVSEPAASKLLAVAQSRAGCRLFERVKGRLVPTPEAHVLYEEIERVWRGVERVRALGRDLGGAKAGSLRIAATASLATMLVPHAVAQVLQDRPMIDLNVSLLVPALVQRALEDGDAEVGILLQAPPLPNLEVLASLACGVVCAMAPDHRLAQRRHITASDLRGERLISYPEVRPVAQELLQGRDIDLELRSGPASCWFARAGVGVALVDRATVAGPGIQVHWRPFKAPARLHISVIGNPARPLSALAHGFVEELQRSARTLLR